MKKKIHALQKRLDIWLRMRYLCCVIEAQPTPETKMTNATPTLTESVQSMFNSLALRGYSGPFLQFRLTNQAVVAHGMEHGSDAVFNAVQIALGTCVRMKTVDGVSRVCVEVAA